MASDAMFTSGVGYGYSGSTNGGKKLNSSYTGKKPSKTTQNTTTGKKFTTQNNSGSTASGSGSSYWMPQIPTFVAPTVDRSVYEKLAQNILDAQLASLDTAVKSQEMDAYNAQKAARSDYFDQYRQAQYNRASTGLGSSPLGQTQERQVQLAMSDTIGDIMNTLSNNIAQLDSQKAQAIAQKDVNAENMYQQAQQIAFDQAMKEFNAQLSALGLAQQMYSANNSGSLSALQQQAQQQALEAEQKAQQQSNLQNQIAMLQTAIDSSKNASEKARLAVQMNELQNQLYGTFGGSSFTPYTTDYSSLYKSYGGGNNSLLNNLYNIVSGFGGNYAGLLSGLNTKYNS